MMNELVDRQRQVPGLGWSGILVAESDEIVIERDESIVGESDSKDVGSQVSKAAWPEATGRISTTQSRFQTLEGA